eukprot:TRINITY_DN454_c0_g1_i1.p1 TRINITY_DN454_c0_g1~~TRINITY_DN454_c0_g1_i1.p1  ORF type:complete len:104 (-),score=68.54 TRINITY_DN454_c0_g1_i1:55-366(-)
MATNNLKAKFERAASDAATTKQGSIASSWNKTPDLPTAKNTDGSPSATGLKAKFEYLANPPPRGKEMGTISWQGQNNEGQKKVVRAGYDPTKPPPTRSIADLP